VVVKPQFQYANDFNDRSLAIVKLKGKRGLINEQGELVLDCQYSEIKFNECDAISIEKNEKWGLLNAAMKTIYPCELDEYQRVGFNCITGTKINNKYGYANMEGELVVPAIYDTVGAFDSYGAFVCLEGKWGMISEDAEFVLQPTFSKLRHGGEGYLVGKEKGLYGIYDTLGTVHEPPTYDFVGYFFDQKVTVKRNGDWGSWEAGMEDLEDEELYLMIAEHPPEYVDCDERPGCSSQRLMEFIYSNVRYPSVAKENGIQGLVVIKFLIDHEGKTSDFEIVSDIGGGCGEEAMRVAKKMGDWEVPGTLQGRTFLTYFNLPIRFKLE